MMYLEEKGKSVCSMSHGAYTLDWRPARLALVRFER